MAKEATGTISLQVPAGAANPAPPIGPALGQHGVNIGEFVKRFNDETADMERGMPIPVIITVYKDRTFDFVKKTPPASFFLKKLIKKKGGANNPGTEVIATVKRSQLKEIAEAKMEDLNANDIEAAISIIAGSARSMGIEVVEG